MSTDRGRPIKRGSFDKLSRREREVMNAIVELGNRASVEDIQARIVDPPSYSSIRVMLSRLERKGNVKHHEEGRRYIYSATTSPLAVRKAALRQFVRTFFQGSVVEMMTALVRQEPWREGDLDALKREIERVRREMK